VHGSRPWLGKNAIDNLIDFLLALKKEFVEEPCGIKEHFHDTLNLGKIEGGQAVNQVPTLARAMVDIRYTGRFINLKKKISRLKSRFPNITLQELNNGKPYFLNIEDRYFKLFLKTAKENFKIKPRFLVSHGSSDARFFMTKNISTIVVRPTGGGHHSEKEWIDLKDLRRFYLVLKAFVDKLFVLA